MYIYTSNLVANFLVNNLWTAKWFSRYHPLHITAITVYIAEQHNNSVMSTLQ